MNVLNGARSRYLRQHAQQPVHWQPWSESILDQARAQDKPILLSIGFSSCHWCHVMAGESFDDDEIAHYMNEHFINVKIDREEHPALDTYYMAACEAITGKGGWPLNVFLTPEGEAFFAGTYFPPVPGLRQRSWMQALQLAAYNFYEQREVVNREASRIKAKILTKEQNVPVQEGGDFFSLTSIERYFQQLKTSFDTEEGGFGLDKKFPNTSVLEFLMDYAWHESSIPALQQVEMTVDRMLSGGMYDHVGGGFFRYTVDRKWKVPHFEKMLFDNALIIRLLSRLYKWRKRKQYLKAINQTFNFLKRELKRAEGGYYASLDAVSNGKEGGYYTWTYEEINTLQIEPDQLHLFVEYFQISKSGNWKGSNVLHANKSITAFAKQKRLPEEMMHACIQECLDQLFQKRTKRTNPAVDDKINLAWNAVALSAFIEAYGATQDAEYLKEAEALQQFICGSMGGDEGRLRHLLQNDHLVYLEDYAHTIAALLQLQTINADHSLIGQAASLAEKALFIFRRAEGHLLNVRPSNLNGTPYNLAFTKDEDLPNANAIMAMNLQKLAVYVGRTDWHEWAQSMLLEMGQAFEKEPLPLSSWALLWLSEVKEPTEFAVAGPEAGVKARAINNRFWGQYAMMYATEKTDEYPLLVNRFQQEETLIYVCKNFACRQPVRAVDDIYSCL